MGVRLPWRTPGQQPFLVGNELSGRRRLNIAVDFLPDRKQMAAIDARGVTVRVRISRGSLWRTRSTVSGMADMCGGVGKDLDHFDPQEANAAPRRPQNPRPVCRGGNYLTFLVTPAALSAWGLPVHSPTPRPSASAWA
jgi:hypothetical protein